MSKAQWKDCEGTWDRIRWARIQWQEQNGITPNAEAAAESLGIKPGTYRAYERRPDSSKHIALDHQSAIRFARKFGVSWEWLLIGSGMPTDQQLSPAQERIVRALGEMPEERQDAMAAALEALIRTGT
jgi:hypothetical protein